jgi:hypothetical protein
MPSQSTCREHSNGIAAAAHEKPVSPQSESVEDLQVLKTF